MAVKKLWWDAGHGGTDPGAVGNGLHESDLNLKIVNYAMAYLEKNYTGFEQRTTRKGDQTVELSKRDDAPDAWGADVFTSIHINAGGGTGFETFVHPQCSKESKAYQDVLHAEVLAAMRKFEPKLKDRGQKSANHSVTRETNMPAVLSENLFIDTKADADLLKKEAFLKAVGEAHAIAVAKFTKLPKKAVSAPKPAEKPSTNDIYSVQVFAGSKAGADRVVEQAKKAGFKDAYAWKK